MLQNTPRHLVAGLVGPIEIALDFPAPHLPCRGMAFVGHPHPLYGGTLENKVAATLARTYASLGWFTVRPNFRGVGRSAGQHDEGRGEALDLLHLIDTRHQWAPPLMQEAGALLHTTPAPQAALALAGFSFGSFVATQVACALFERGIAVQSLVLAGTAAGKWAFPELPDALRGRTLLVHGELDNTIPLANVLDWARPQELPILVFPGGDHFFHRRLTRLRDYVAQHIAAHFEEGENRPLSQPSIRPQSIDAAG